MFDDAKPNEKINMTVGEFTAAIASTRRNGGAYMKTVRSREIEAAKQLAEAAQALIEGKGWICDVEKAVKAWQKTRIIDLEEK